ncbi:hypothetical protein ACVSTM_22540, partial [Yersinia enterocolitica]
IDCCEAQNNPGQIAAIQNHHHQHTDNHDDVVYRQGKTGAKGGSLVVSYPDVWENNIYGPGRDLRTVCERGHPAGILIPGYARERA